ncbi:hypothetical protein ACET53_17090 [Aeromonas veronii]
MNLTGVQFFYCGFCEKNFTGSQVLSFSIPDENGGEFGAFCCPDCGLELEPEND